MTENPGWYFDESHMAGIDYCSEECAGNYDASHQRFRNYQAEAEEIIKTAGLDETSTVIDLGTGTGAFVLNAARHCRRIIAVDVSPSMLEVCRRKAEALGLENIVFRTGGFLSYEHQGPLVDAVISVAVLHHLPDYWKQVGLKRIAKMIRPGGCLLLRDVVFPSQPENLDETIDAWIKWITGNAGPDMGREAEVHIKDEYSTYDWIMEGMLNRAGFYIESVDYRDGFMASYLCSLRG